MQLGINTVEREPIVFDKASLPDGYRDREGGMFMAFVTGKARFDSELQTAVAMSEGIDDNGILDLEILAGVEQAAEYLSDKQGQPLFLVETSRDPGSEDIRGLSGFLAVVADVEKPVGIHITEKLNREVPGIAVMPKFTRPSGYRQGGRYWSQYQSDMDGSRIEFVEQHFAIGSPGYKRRADDETEYRQYIVAGEEIVPWIEEVFVGDDRYFVYKDVVTRLAMRRAEDIGAVVLDSLLIEPYVSKLEKEYLALQDVSNTLDHYEQVISDAEKIISGAEGNANIALRAVSDKNPKILSYPGSVNVTAPVDGGEGAQLERRRRTINYETESLQPILSRVSQLR